MMLQGVRIAAIASLVMLTVSGIPVDEDETKIEQTAKCELSSVVCSCGAKATFVRQQVQMCRGKKGDCVPCSGEKKPEDVCKRFRYCETCVPGLNVCFTCPQGASGLLCNDGSIMTEWMEPMKYYFPAGGDSRRFTREIDTKLCRLPDNMEHADYYCTLYPDRIKCDIHCLHGFALPVGGTKKRLRCLFDEGRWYPTNWDDCKSYMNCKMTLVEPGHYFCTYDMQTPTRCWVSCEANDERPAVPRAEHICDGHWDPEMPFCIKEEHGTDLGPPGK